MSISFEELKALVARTPEGSIVEVRTIYTRSGIMAQDMWIAGEQRNLNAPTYLGPNATHMTSALGAKGLVALTPVTPVVLEALNARRSFVKALLGNLRFAVEVVPEVVV